VKRSLETYRTSPPGVVRDGVVGDGLGKVGFTESHTAVHQKRVVIGAARLLCHGVCGAAGEAITIALDKLVEGVLGPKVLLGLLVEGGALVGRAGAGPFNARELFGRRGRFFSDLRVGLVGDGGWAGTRR
jgi:hypothetical protein